MHHWILLLLVTVFNTVTMAAPRGFHGVPSSELRAVRAEAKRLVQEIRFHRKRKGFTQEALAEEIGISVEALRAIEIGLRMPSFPMLIRIARALKLEIALLIK